jgi:O-antigen/teichoic acid export membrane protein
MNAAVGFVFIFLAAKFYSIDTVGIAMLLISYASIVVLVSRFGIEQSMIRYFNADEKSLIFCSTVIATTISAIVIGIILVLISYFGLLGQDILTTYSIVFIIGVCLLSVSEVSGIFFLANKKPHLYLIQSIIISSRLLFLVFFVSFGVIGLFSSLIVAMGLSVVFSLPFIYQQGVKKLVTGKKFLTDSFHFSLGNYIGDVLLTSPVYIIPIMVFIKFGQKETAIYSVGYAIASIAFLIPTSIGFATFISGCRDDAAQVVKRERILPTLVLLIGIILVFFFWGKEIIGILGPDYAGTSDLVVTIMSASVFALFFQLYSAEFKIQKQIKKLILFNAVFFIAVILLSYIFMIYAGLLGAGYAWIAAYAICVVPLIIFTTMKSCFFLRNTI